MYTTYNRSKTYSASATAFISLKRVFVSQNLNLIFEGRFRRFKEVKHAFLFLLKCFQIKTLAKLLKQLPLMKQKDFKT